MVLFALTPVVMCGIIGLGVVGGFVISRIRLNRYLKVFNEDCTKPFVNQSN